MTDNGEEKRVAYLRTPQAIRDRSTFLFERCLQNELDHFTCDLSRLDEVVDRVLAVTRDRYPTLEIPFHSRWRHFSVGERDRLAQLQAAFPDSASQTTEAIALAKAEIDLAVTSVLLDAGAGAAWRYVEPETDMTWARSEGLAVASFHAFRQGLFSANPDRPWQANASKLRSLSEADLARAFQVSDANPLVGLAGRLALMHRLGDTLAQQWPQSGVEARPGNVLDDLRDCAIANSIQASEVLAAVLQRFGDIWPGRYAIAGINLGDVWPHPAIPEDGFVPFHKLSQWLTYSLVEPLANAGLHVTDLDALTGLAEYRNGGLLLDAGVLVPRREEIFTGAYRPSDPVIVEWRSLTVALLDRVAARLRERLNLSASELPLVKVLEGGTWHAGRQIAATLRPTGVPPIQLDSDGTVF
ncbi:MAG: URC4/urg3 family protein [Cyanobacteria bacterium J06639_1]